VSGRRHRDEGFALVELLVTSSLALVVLLAILGALDVFSGTSSATARAPIAEETARATLRQMVDDLRQARVPTGETTPIDHTSTGATGDLVAAAWLDDGTAAPRAGWLRYCVTADGRSLVAARRYAAAWPGAPGACATTSTTDPALGWVARAIVPGSLVPGGVFTFTSDACFGTTGSCPPAATAVRAIGIRLRLQARDAGGRGRTIDQTGTVGLRNRP
jgi:hypothetical protein